MTDPYLFSLALGGAGLATMAAIGAAGGAGHGAHGAGVHHGHAGGHVGHHGHLHGGRAGAAHHAAPGIKAAPAGPRWTLLLSPRVLFSVLVGFGAVGLALRSLLGGPWLLGAAAAGGLALEMLVIAPAWNFLLNFASRPALTLDHGIMDEAEAVTAFNAQGDGLVKLIVDGQVVQLLGTLTAPEREAGVRVKAGDRLVVEAVDGGRQRCTVSRRADP
jgi:hypothetical protein